MAPVLSPPAPTPAKPPSRPGAARKSGAFLFDLSLCALLAWNLDAVTGAGGRLAASLGLALLAGMRLWFRDRLRPTPGESAMGIRYLTSQSSQVVAEIQVLVSKPRLGAPLLAAGLVESALGFGILAAWTITDRFAAMGRVWEGPMSFGLILGLGALHLTCAFKVFSGARDSLWRVPVSHALMSGLLASGLPAWGSILPEALRTAAAPVILVHAAWGALFTLLVIGFRAQLNLRFPRG